MKKETKKKKMSLKRLKRILKNVGKEFVDYFKSIWKKFSSLPKHIKTICGVWLAVIVIIIVIIFASSTNKKHLEEYYELEDLVKEATLKYVEKANIYPVKDSKLKLDIEELKEFSSFSSKELDDKACKGFSLTYYNEDEEEYVIRSFIKCDKYTTKEYSDYK